MYRFTATKVTGTIKVPAVSDRALNGFGCNNLSVTAVSKDGTQNGLVFVPKWTRSGEATGTFSSGSCSYTLHVPATKEFSLTTSGHGNYHCDIEGGGGGSAGPLSVAFNTTKTQDIKINSVVCEVIQ